MTVEELISELQKCDPQTEIFYTDWGQPSKGVCVLVSGIQEGEVHRGRDGNGDRCWLWGNGNGNGRLVSKAVRLQ